MWPLDELSGQGQVLSILSPPPKPRGEQTGQLDFMGAYRGPTPCGRAVP